MSNKFLAVAQLAYFKSIAKSFSTNYSPKKEKFVVTMYRTLYYIISIILLVGSFYSMWIAAYK